MLWLGTILLYQAWGILSNVSITQQQAGFRGLSPTVISSDSFGKDCLLYGDSSSEVQCGQRVALIGMLNRQYGQSLAVGSAGGASSFLLSMLICRMRRNTAKATMMKLMSVFTNTPSLTVTALAFCASARVE